MSWQLILHVLYRFGFLIYLTARWLLSLVFLIFPFLLMAFFAGCFSCSRDICQGDLFSPFLFCIAKDFLGWYLTHFTESNVISCMSSPCGSCALFDLFFFFFFANDVLIFSKATNRNTKYIFEAFSLYGSLLGPSVNWEKMNIYFDNSIAPRRFPFLL